MTTTAAPTQPVTITLAVPTSFAVDPVRLVAWLVERGYADADGKGAGLWTHYKRGAWGVDVPLRAEYSDYPRCLRDAIVVAATNEQIDPHALAALLASPAEGPALQWAHASADTRAPVLALLDGPAVEHRAAATLARMADDIESALAHDGKAMALEAAAAVLRAAIK